MPTNNVAMLSHETATATETSHASLFDRVATAPISWGVCEMPGWGHQLPVHSVLSEMAAAGFTHTELGAIGYLPTDPTALHETLQSYGLKLLGGFVPLVLHDPAEAATAVSQANRSAELLSAAGGQFLVTCAVSHQDRWRQQPLDNAGQTALCASLESLDRVATAHGLQHVFHSHFGSLVETDAELAQVLAGSNVSLVLDTAHLTLGGTDVLQFVDQYSHRVGLVHVKDVDPALAVRLRAGGPSEQSGQSLMGAVQQGLFPPLGQGGVPIAEIVTRLEESGRDLWYVLEQDAAITADDPSALAQLRRNAEASLAFLRSLLPAAAGRGTTHNNHQPIPEG